MDYCFSWDAVAMLITVALGIWDIVLAGALCRQGSNVLGHFYSQLTSRRQELEPDGRQNTRDIKNMLMKTPNFFSFHEDVCSCLLAICRCEHNV